MKKFKISKSLVQHSPKIALLAVAILVFTISIAQAVEIPPAFSTAFIQTNGPNAPLSVGDFYTSVDGADEIHFVRVQVPCTWPPDFPVTFALFDPESQEPDPDVSLPDLADDEIRNDQGDYVLNPPNENVQFADEATYSLFKLGPGNAVDLVVGPVTYVPTTTITSTTNGRWVELVTFTPNTPNFGCGIYALAAEVSDNDENAWKLAVSHDPDCTVSVPNPGSCSGIGQAQSDLLSNGNEQDDADTEVGTGDELLITLDQISFQHEAPNDDVLNCQQFFHPVLPDDAPQIRLHNFDLDIDNSTGANSTVTHIAPSGREIDGAGSRNQAWNNASDPPSDPPEREGDLISIAPDEVGLWVTEICVRRANQYIYEGQQDEIIFLEPPPIPVMRVSKDDGRIIVNPDEVLTYTIGFTNVSDTERYPLPPPVNEAPPGAAFSATLTDELPAFTTFVSCRINPPLTGTCVENPPGIVTFRINEVIEAGDSGTTEVTVLVDSDAPPGLITDTVVLTYTDLVGIEYPPRQDTDVNEIPPQPPTATPTASPTTTPTPQPAPSLEPSPTPTPKDDDDDDDDGESSPPTPVPPTSQEVASAPTPAPAEPTATATSLPVTFLPETGERGVAMQQLILGFGLFIMMATGIIVLIRLIHQKQSQRK